MVSRIIHNAQSGETETIEVDNAWILANRPAQVALNLSNPNPALNETITLSAQLKSHPLTDDSQVNLNDNVAIRLQIGDIVQDAQLVNGVWSDSLQFVLAGDYTIRCLSHVSNEITVLVS